MRLLPEWKWLLRKAWSIRLHLLSGICSIIALVLPFVGDKVPVQVLIGLATIATFGGMFSQLVAQPKMERRIRPRGKPDGAKADYD